MQEFLIFCIFDETVFAVQLFYVHSPDTPASHVPPIPVKHIQMADFECKSRPIGDGGDFKEVLKNEAGGETCQGLELLIK